MRKSIIFALFVTTFALGSAGYCQKGAKEKAESHRMVQIGTDYGNMVIKLYNETPGHRDNFIKLAESGKFNGSIFHRVIKDFMVQGGEFPGCDYTIPAEITPRLAHKKGSLAAARTGDDVNPRRESSGCQFYIVHGRMETEANLKMMENRKNQMMKNQLMGEFFQKPENASYKEKMMKFQQERNNEAIQALYAEIDPMVEKELAAKKFSYTAEQIKAYTTIGGTPHLDGAYTVFGEVVEGMEVVDKIAAVQTAPGDKPLQDVKMTVKVLK
jgi:cyclophilin family peptidyl-prolyl cis-trans isomerase